MSGPGFCASCGHDPACGFASIDDSQGFRWLCHDDDHSCYQIESVMAEVDANDLRLFQALDRTQWRPDVEN